jgi:hypothetical protein
VVSESTRRVVDALEAAGRPLDRDGLRERTDLPAPTLEGALDTLRGQQVVRRVPGPDRDAFRLTYWPDERDCVVCGEEIVGEEYYELELRPQATNTEPTTTGSLHAACAQSLFDDLYLERDE